MQSISAAQRSAHYALKFYSSMYQQQGSRLCGTIDLTNVTWPTWDVCWTNGWTCEIQAVLKPDVSAQEAATGLTEVIAPMSWRSAPAYWA